MKCYPEHKDSQLDWVGEIPQHWQVIKFRYISQESRRKNDDDVDREMLSLSSYTGVQRKHYEYESTKRTKDESLTYLVVEPSQLVVNPMWQMKRSIGVSYLHGIVSPGYRVYFVDLERLAPQYLHHLMRSDNYVDEYNKHVRGATTYDRSVKKEDFEEIGVLLPPKEEQTQIANFLDRKTQQIDELIRVKERKIELLGEYRASLIQQAVTKGLDPNVEMKPSGVEWIGNVPKHWEVKKIKYLARLISKGTTPTTIGREILDHGEIRFIKAENIVDNQVKLDPEYYIDEETNQMLKRSQLRENDILFVIAGATIGKVSVVRREHLPANTNQAVSFIRPHGKELPEFIYHWLQSDYIQQTIWREVVQSAQPNLSMEDLGNLYIPYPSIAEQERIVDYISNKTRSIAQLLQQVYRQIELLKEYRQSLISQVVTGKIDVRDEV